MTEIDHWWKHQTELNDIFSDINSWVNSNNAADLIEYYSI